MKFITTAIDGVAILELEERRDDRGFFARAFCHDEFVAHGLLPDVLQCNISYNRFAGTLRGMHYQVAPATEAKLVRCIIGAVVATYLGQAIGWYRADEGAGLIGAVVGAIIVLVIWGMLAGRRERTSL